MLVTGSEVREAVREVRRVCGEPSLVLARGATAEVTRAYWRAFSRGEAVLRSPDDFGISPPAMPSAAATRLQQLGSGLSEISPLDASFAVGRLYMALLPSGYRSQHGIYFTPPALARRLIDLVNGAREDIVDVRVLDPACGGGAFLAPVASLKLAALKGESPNAAASKLAATLRGYELDPFSAWLSQVFLEAVTLPLVRAGAAPLPLLVEVRDALQASTTDSFDVVIGNPPYGRTVLSKQARQRYARSVFGHANLYGLFTDLALRLARPGGHIAFVTPTSFLAGQYFKNLRSLLAQEAPPEVLEFVSDRDGVFDDVLQETLLALYRKGTGVQAVPRPARVLRIRPEGDLDVVPAGEFRLPADPHEPWIIPRSQEQARLVEVARHQPTRLRDLGYRVSTGPLVWNRHKSQLHSAPGANRYPLIWAEAVTADGRFEFRADRKNHRPYFELRPSDGDWLLAHTPRVLLQRTTAKEQARRLIAAELPPGFLAKHGAVVVENHLNMIYADDPPRVSAGVIAALLRSRVIDELFRCISGSVAVSAFELEALPLPDVATLDRLERLLEENAPSAEIDALLEDAYYADVPVAS